MRLKIECDRVTEWSHPITKEQADQAFDAVRLDQADRKNIAGCLTPMMWRDFIDVATRIAHGYGVALPDGGEFKVWVSSGQPPRLEWRVASRSTSRESEDSMKTETSVIMHELLVMLKEFVDAYGDASYLSEEEKEAEPHVQRARAVIARAKAMLSTNAL